MLKNRRKKEKKVLAVSVVFTGDNIKDIENYTTPRGLSKAAFLRFAALEYIKNENEKVITNGKGNKKRQGSESKALVRG